MNPTFRVPLVPKDTCVCTPTAVAFPKHPETGEVSHCGQLGVSGVWSLGFRV